LTAMPEVMFQVIAMIFHGVETLVLDPPIKSGDKPSTVPRHRPPSQPRCGARPAGP
jgi:hypothetical protein